MKTPPPDLGSDEIVEALAQGWDMRPAALDYAALGFGSHHWIASISTNKRVFVTVDDLRASHLGPNEAVAFQRLNTAFSTARTLREVASLPFVIAPLPSICGEVVRRVGGHYALSIFPFLDVAPTEYGEFRNPVDRDEALALIGRVHSATSELAPTGLRQDTLMVPHEAELLMALNEFDEPWMAGPYGEPARALLRDASDMIHARLRRFAALRETVEADRADWVISHGETHASNVIRTRSGELVMVDWDTVAVAPRERDLWNLVTEHTPDWTPYRHVTGVESLSVAAMEAYRMHWGLSEIAIYTLWCRSPHEWTEEMDVAWRELQSYVA